MGEQKKHDFLPSRWPASLRLCCLMFCILCSIFLSALGCGVGGQSIDALFAAANSQIASAEKAGADQLAQSELEEAEALLAEAEIASKNRDKATLYLLEKAHAKARLAEALSIQAKAENEAMQLEAELERASAEASQARLERVAAESELDQITKE